MKNEDLSEAQKPSFLRNFGENLNLFAKFYYIKACPLPGRMVIKGDNFGHNFFLLHFILRYMDCRNPKWV